jgi:hypothetical protein
MTYIYTGVSPISVAGVTLHPGKHDIREMQKHDLEHDEYGKLLITTGLLIFATADDEAKMAKLEEWHKAAQERRLDAFRDRAEAETKAASGPDVFREAIASMLPAKQAVIETGGAGEAPQPSKARVIVIDEKESVSMRDAITMGAPAPASERIPQDEATKAETATAKKPGRLKKGKTKE